MPAPGVVGIREERANERRRCGWAWRRSSCRLCD